MSRHFAAEMEAEAEAIDGWRTYAPVVLLLVVHAAVTWTLVGLIWTVQVVHYPLFEDVDRSPGGFYVAYQQRHMQRITWLVGPLMIAEAVLAFRLAATPPPGVPRWLLYAGAALLVLIWLSTALVQAPLHGRLTQGFDPRVHCTLVSTNWVRTLAWTARGVIASALLLA